MKSVWKGLMVGGITGAVVGSAIDAVGRASEWAKHVSVRVRMQTPDSAQKMKTATGRAQRAITTEVPDHRRQSARRTLDSEPASQAAPSGSRISKLATSRERSIAPEGFRSTKHRNAG